MSPFAVLFTLAFVACASARAPHCDLEAETGPCRGYFIRYYFDKELQKCKRFTYGGCDGNDNNHATLGECKVKCETAESTNEICLRPAKPGPCMAYIPSYYYDMESKTCKQFIYGGCQTNWNKFETEQDCLDACHHSEEKSAKSSDEVCLRPSYTGPCRARFQRYFFNSETKKCETFNYGGCQSNGNNFSSEKECLDACQ